jgi:hypothetical protein
MRMILMIEYEYTRKSPLLVTRFRKLTLQRVIRQLFGLTSRRGSLDDDVERSCPECQARDWSVLRHWLVSSAHGVVPCQ